MPPTHTLPASTGTALHLSAHQKIHITNPHGTQVVDFWALSTPHQYLSTSHTHSILRKLTPTPSDILYSSTSHPLLHFTSDTTNGTHDTLIAACNPTRYKNLGVQTWHASCEENFSAAVAALGVEWVGAAPAPAPVNLFMNVGVARDGRLEFGEPGGERGGGVVFEALVDLVVVISACPMDLRASESWWPVPREVGWEVLG